MRIINSVLVLILIFLNYGCEKNLTSKGVSSITNYVTFDLTGGSTVLLPKGGTYSDPGYKAMEGETDVTNVVTVESTVNGNQVGMYTVTYSALNKEGYASSIERTVIIYDAAAPNVDLAGNYLSTVSRAAPYSKGPYFDLTVSITKIAPGFFYISDFLGGFYDQGSAYKYGPTYAMTGYFSLNPDYTITLISSHVAAWGDSLRKLTLGVYNPTTGSLSWHAFYTANYDFTVTMDKQ